MQSEFPMALNMPAISNSKLTIYACNFYPRGTIMLAMSKIVLDSPDYDFWTNLAKTNFQCLQAYLVPVVKKSQAYMVRFGFGIEGIFSPL